MTTDHRNMEGWLTELGAAHNAGAFSSNAGRYPWQTVEPRVIRLAHRRLAWVRMAIPLAAAAAVAVLFVAPSFKASRTVHPVPAIANSTIPETSHDGPIAEVPPSKLVPNCDYNGDGVVNGRDIQSLVDRAVQGSDESPDDLAKSAEQLKSCLLGM